MKELEFSFLKMTLMLALLFIVLGKLLNESFKINLKKLKIKIFCSKVNGGPIAKRNARFNNNYFLYRVANNCKIFFKKY
jgi:hypothetical protein